LSSIQPLFFPETEFSSEVDFQNSVTSKPFSGQSRMYNSLKSGRVVQVFSVQLRERILLEQFHFCFFLNAVRFYTDFSFYLSEVIRLGLVTFSWLCFQVNMDDYPYFFLAKDGRLCSIGQHCPEFPQVLYDAFLHLGYDGEVYLPLLLVYGRWPGHMQDQRDDTPQPDGSVDGDRRWQ
jgi:hypothetical protein